MLKVGDGHRCEGRENSLTENTGTAFCPIKIDEIASLFSEIWR